MYTYWLVEILLHLCPFECPSSSGSSFSHPAVRVNRSAQLQSPLAGCMMHSNRVPVAVTVAVSSWQNRTWVRHNFAISGLVSSLHSELPKSGAKDSFAWLVIFFCLGSYSLISTGDATFRKNTLKEQPLNTSSETELLSKTWLSHGLAAIHCYSQLQSMYSCDGSLGACPPQLLQEEYVPNSKNYIGKPSLSSSAPSWFHDGAGAVQGALRFGDLNVRNQAKHKQTLNP